MVKRTKVLTLGSDPTGYTAAIYAARANLNPVLITGLAQGGQPMTTTDMENWSADKGHLQSLELVQCFLEYAERSKIEVLFDHTHTTHLKEKPIRLVGNSGEYTCDALIVSTGVPAQYLGLPSGEAFVDHGMSAYATCDGFFYKGQGVAVMDDGNIVVEEAFCPADVASKTMLTHRHDKFRTEPILIDRLHEQEKKDKVEIKINMVLDEILGGESGMTDVRLKGAHGNEGKTEEIKLAGVFVVIGHKPNTNILRDQLDMNDTDCIHTKSGLGGMATVTNTPGVFAAGDVQDHIYRQAIISAGTGCMVALDVQCYLESLKQAASPRVSRVQTTRPMGDHWPRYHVRHLRIVGTRPTPACSPAFTIERAPSPVSRLSLTDLVGLHDQLKHETQIRETECQRIETATRKVAEEANVLHASIGEVSALRQNKRVEHPYDPSAPEPVHSRAEEQVMLRNSLSDELGVDNLLKTDDMPSYRRPGIGDGVLKKLRRGEWATQDQIGLHDMRHEEARKALAAFLRRAAQRGIRYARVTYGKGFGSPDKMSVLKGEVRSWLVQKEEVIVFVEPHNTAGDAGAVLVLLRQPYGS